MSTTLLDVVRGEDPDQMVKIFDFWLNDNFKNRWPYRLLKDVAVTNDVAYVDKGSQDLWTGWRSALRLTDAKVDSILAAPHVPELGMCRRHRQPRPCPECVGSKTPG